MLITQKLKHHGNILELSIEPYNDGIDQWLCLHYFCPLSYL